MQILIMGHAINWPVNGNNAVDWFNTTDKRYLNKRMELIDKLASNDTPKIIILPRESKDVSVKFSEQCLHIITNNNGLNGIKGSTKIQKRQSLLKYQSRLYNIKINDDFKCIGMKLRWNNKLFPLLNLIHAK